MSEGTNNDEWNTIVPMDNWDTGLRPGDSAYYSHGLNNRVEQFIKDNTKQQKIKSSLYVIFVSVICLSVLIFGYKIIHAPSESEKSITIEQVFPDKTYKEYDRYGDIKDQY